MTLLLKPKDKAYQLFEKYFVMTNYGDQEIDRRFSKMYAIILVDEILKAQGLVYGTDENGVVFSEFWQEVKQEIEKL